ncbi:hypothetical protein EDD16DRAFT_1521894 [Pisolithus croceorrhizus]|nr:hypothetical protein EDD16DRAFT_1521894 [Pisolithus croceorrhizus]KAI6124357.1 hypothetical protein EV401DRAFT_1886367 [Pisolithus croceorrhizus]KAI6159700.1 hypothetical protein EDD17DRAFT_1511121 [Pisolithus thermaeus]
MPQGKDKDVLRFSGHLDNLIWCPTVCYSKHDLYNLVDKQKKVKIDSYKALLDYRQYADDPWPACQVTQEAERLLEMGYHLELREAHIVRDQQSAQEAQYEAEMQELRAARAEEKCQGLEGCSKSERLGSTALQAPGSTVLKDSLKLLKVPGEGSRSQVVEVDGIKVTSYIVEESLTAGLCRECLQEKLEEQSEGKLLGAKASVELKATQALGNLPVPQPKYFHPSLPPWGPSIEPQDAKDELRAEE